MTACPRCGFDPEMAQPTPPAPDCDCFALQVGSGRHAQTCAMTRWVRGEYVAEPPPDAWIEGER